MPTVLPAQVGISPANPTIEGGDLWAVGNASRMQASRWGLSRVTRIVFSASAGENSTFSSAVNLRLSRTMTSPGLEPSMAAVAASPKTSWTNRTSLPRTLESALACFSIEM